MCHSKDSNHGHSISMDKIDFSLIHTWLKSAEGISHIETIDEKEKEASEKIQEMSYVNPEDLKIPYSR